MEGAKRRPFEYLDEEARNVSFPSPKSLRVVLLSVADSSAFKGERRCARTLKELVSESGLPYHTGDSDEFRLGWPGAAVKTAHTDFDPYAGQGALAGKKYPEAAYYCPVEELWIQGAPMGEDYVDIGCLAGSAGVKLNCRLCGNELGKFVERMS